MRYGSSSLMGSTFCAAQLEIVLEAARRRDQPVDHVLLVGPPGFDKAALAGFVAREMGAGLRTISGRELVQSGDVAAILTDLDPGDVLFIDQIHRVGPKVEALLYTAMEDFQLDIVLGSRRHRPFDSLGPPEVHHRGRYYQPGRAFSTASRSVRSATHRGDSLAGEVVALVRRIWDQAGLSYEDDAAHLVAERSMGVPWRAYIFASLVVRSQPLLTTLAQRSLPVSFTRFSKNTRSMTRDSLKQTGGCKTCALETGSTSMALMARYQESPRSFPRRSPWKADSDTRDAFGSLAEALPYRLVMPRLHSRDAIILRWEARNIPLIA